MKSMPEVVLDKSLSHMFLLMVLDLVMKVVTNKSLIIRVSVDGPCTNEGFHIAHSFLVHFVGSSF